MPPGAPAPDPPAAAPGNKQKQPGRPPATHKPAFKPSQLPLLGRAPRRKKKKPLEAWHQYTKPSEQTEARDSTSPLKCEKPNYPPLLPAGVPAVPLSLAPSQREAFQFIHAPALVLPTIVPCPPLVPGFGGFAAVLPSLSPAASGFGALPVKLGSPPLARGSGAVNADTSNSPSTASELDASATDSKGRVIIADTPSSPTSGFDALASLAELCSRAEYLKCDGDPDRKTKAENTEDEPSTQEGDGRNDYEDDHGRVIEPQDTKHEIGDSDTAEDKSAIQESMAFAEDDSGAIEDIKSERDAARNLLLYKRKRSPDGTDDEHGRRIMPKPSPSASTFLIPVSNQVAAAAPSCAGVHPDPRNLNVFFPNYLALAQHHMMVHSKPGLSPTAVSPPPPDSLLARLAAAIMSGDYQTAGVLEFQAASLVAAMAAFKAEGGTALVDVPSAAAKAVCLSAAAAAVPQLLPVTKHDEPGAADRV
ncbi:hypothetical protein HDU86_003246 [Geranomyces michiganensis]|nr:hypothetical protein HDU86_003246 [Geranomyces michiganensis]